MDQGILIVGDDHLRVVFDLVFLDPPYGKALGEKAIASCIAGNWLADQALIIWEESSNILPPENFEILDARKYGGSTITILQWNG